MKRAMKKFQETDETFNINNSSDGSPDDQDTNKFCNQGVKPKVKNYFCLKTSKPQKNILVQNGSTSSMKEKVNGTQNGASCSYSVPSTSSVNKSLSSSYENNSADYLGEKCSAKGRTLSSEDSELKYQDKKRKTGSFVDPENSSGNEGDEGLSGDDCCIYTYKGDQFADLPNSFFSVNLGLEEKNQQQRNNHRKANNGRELQAASSNPGSSPEMDFLEMDFDPGPSLEQDSEDEIDGKRSNDVESPDPSRDSLKISSNKEFVKVQMCQDKQDQSGPSSLKLSPKKCNKSSDFKSNNFAKSKNSVVTFCEDCSSEAEINQNDDIKEKTKKETLKLCDNVVSFNCQTSGEERLERNSLTENNDKYGSVKIEIEGNSKLPFDGVMLWSEQEALSKQVTLVSSDLSCGAAAVINAMLVLKMRFSFDNVKEAISARLKSDSASIPQYLVSRSFAGVAHENLIRGIHHASNGALYARFFQMYPRREVALSRWLSHWMKKGAVPIVTMNVQRDANREDSTLDTRHHQMIFGVSSKGIYLTDPLECLQDEELWYRLISPSVLKIKRHEIVSRWSPGTNLRPLMFQSDDRWKKMNVLGQVVNVIRESPDPGAQGKFLTQHITIPASSGITLVVPRNSQGYEDLVSAADLPILSALKPE